jgi:FixJ family two-component response regulator
LLIHPLLRVLFAVPVMDGREATQRLNALGYRAPIIAMTANATVCAGRSLLFLFHPFL